MTLRSFCFIAAATIGCGGRNPFGSAIEDAKYRNSFSSPKPGVTPGEVFYQKCAPLCQLVSSISLAIGLFESAHSTVPGIAHDTFGI